MNSTKKLVPELNYKRHWSLLIMRIIGKNRANPRMRPLLATARHDVHDHTSSQLGVVPGLGYHVAAVRSGTG